MKLVNLISVLVRRDAQTTTPTSVPEHELPVLRSIFGKDNVTGNDVVGQRKIDEAGEYARLVAKYGVDRVEKVYGDEESGKLESAIKEAKPVKADRTQGTTPPGATGTGAAGAQQ